jgi:hypothetical protein
MVLRLDLQHGRWLQAVEEDASLDFRLHNVVIHSMAEVGMRRERWWSAGQALHLSIAVDFDMAASKYPKARGVAVHLVRDYLRMAGSLFISVVMFLPGQRTFAFGPPTDRCDAAQGGARMPRELSRLGVSWEHQAYNRGDL